MKLALLLSLLLLASPAGATWYTYNGTDSNVFVTDSDLELTEFTACVWTRRTGDGEGATGRIIQNDLNTSWNLQFAAATNQIKFEWDGGFAPDGVWEITAPALNASVHVCVHYNNASVSNDPNIWLDGVLQSESEDTTPVGTATGGTRWNWGNRLGATADRTWDGQLGDAAVWARQLSTAEVQQAMAYGPRFVAGGAPLSYLMMGDWGTSERGTATISWSTNGTLTAQNSGPPRSSAQGGFIWLGQ